jgi:hypothetical protein
MKIKRAQLYRRIIVWRRLLRSRFKTHTFHPPARHHVVLGSMLGLIFFFTLVLFILLQLPLHILPGKSDGITKGKQKSVALDTTQAKGGVQQDSSRQGAAAQPESSDEQLAFGYAGVLTIESEWLKGNAGTGDHPDRGQRKGKGTLSGGQNEKKEGAIPEIVLECAEKRIESVIAHYGFLIVATSGSGLVGAVNRTTGELAPLTQRTLDRYSARARSFPGYGRSLLARIQRAHPNLKVIRLLFLCPKEKEDAVISSQLKFAHQLKIPLAEIALMNGYYDKTLQIRFTQAHLRDGRIISG